MNMLSTGNEWTEVDLSRARTTLLIGMNGSGKSTLIDALSLALFNRPFRKITRPQMVNSITCRNLLVEVEFSSGAHEYTVRRGIKPNVFEIWRDGALVPSPADSRDYQEYLEQQVLRFNHRAFTQVVVLGSASYVHFMQLPAQARREVIEELLDIGVFSTMNSLLKERVDANRTAVAANDAALRDVDARAEVNRRHLENMRQDNESLISEKLREVSELECRARELRAAAVVNERDHVSRLRNELSREDELRRAEADALSALSAHKWSAQSLQRERELIEHESSCPECKQAISDDYRVTRLGSIRADLESIAERARGEAERVERARAALRGLAETRGLLESALAEDQRLRSEARENASVIGRLTADIEKLRSRSDVMASGNDIAAELDARRASILGERASLLREAEVISAASSLLKDGGVKARVVKQYLPVLNSFIAKYLASLDFFVDFRLDENFGEVIKSRYRDEFSYESFSEGEKCRINLALLFAWRAVARMRNSVHCNLLVLDEILDGSLDAVGAEEFIKILGAVTEDENVFVISHRGEQLIDKFERALVFDKVKNFSTVSEAA